MPDAAIVATIVAGDHAGLAEAYDRYADHLYAYCQFMLDDPADAADAVEDTFLVAGARLGRLRDPERLRPWLYAVARNQSLQLLSSRSGVRARSAAHDKRGEREAVELCYGRGLELAEVALAMGISHRRAQVLLSRARARIGVTSDAELADAMARRTPPAGGLPDWLADHLMQTAASCDDEALSRQADVRSRARAFRRDGFPRSLDRTAWSPEALAIGAGGAAAIAAVAVALALAFDWQPFAMADPHPLSIASPVGPASPQPATGDAAAPMLPASSPKASASPRRSVVRAPATTHSPAAAAQPTSVQRLAAASGTATARTVAPTTPAPSESPTLSATPTANPAPGTLLISASTLSLTSSAPSGTITLTAEQGPVTWSISQTAGGPALLLSQTKGSLAAGQSVLVTVTAPNSSSGFSTQLLVNPGGQAVAVIYHAGG